MARKKTWILLLAVLLFSACSPHTGPEQLYKPPENKNDGWQVSDLEAQDMDKDLINELLDRIYNSTYQNIHSLVVVRNGFLVVDCLFKTQLTYVDGYVGNTDLELHAVMSVTKSIVSLLTGITIDKNFIAGVSDAVYPFFPEYKPFANWDKNKEKVTIRDFLTMQHGYTWDETSYPYNDPNNSYYQMYQNYDWVKYVLDLNMDSDPGKVFRYSSGVSHTIGKLIANASGRSFEEFINLFLFQPLGITKSKWLRAPNGMPDDVYLTTRDMARFGQLILNKGIWNNTRVVSEKWINNSVSRQVEVDSDFGYCYFWWKYSFNINNTLHEAIFAWGYGGQFIFILDSLNLVVCFTSGNYGNGLESQPFEMVRQYILPAVT